MEYKHFIFDLDGTLVDSEVPILKTWQETFREYNRDYSLEQLKVVLYGPSLTVLRWLNFYDDERTFIQKWQNNYEKYCLEVGFFDGIEKMLKTLKAQGCTLGMVSLRSRYEYQRFFASFHLENYFKYVIFGDDTLDQKPLLKYMEKANAKAEDCIYIGDMPDDVYCANHAHVASGFATWNKSGIICYEAKYIFNNPKDLLQL